MIKLLQRTAQTVFRHEHSYFPLLLAYFLSLSPNGSRVQKSNIIKSRIPNLLLGKYKHKDHHKSIQTVPAARRGGS